MTDLFGALFASDFLPHGWCYRWNPGVVWLHVTSDILIALAYYFIPFSLIYIVRRRGDLVYPWIFWLFGVFILACGTTHLMSVLVVWQPWYRLDGIIKLITAIASVPTAIQMLRIAPAIIAIPSPEQLRIMNRQLEQEIADRKSAEAEILRLNADLERRVAERTAELEKANQRLHASEERLKSILDGTPLLVYMKDPDDRLLFVNRQLERTFGWDRRTVLGTRTADLLPPEVAEAYRAADLQVWADGQPREFEEFGYTRGEKRYYMSIKFPLFAHDGRPWAICGMSADITDRKHSEDALRRYTSELEGFAYAAAHDLQEPLRTVKNFTQLLVRRYRGLMDPDADEFMGYISGGVDRMQQLVDALQTWSELKRSQSSEASADAGNVLADTVRLLQTTIEEAGAEVTAGELPVVGIGAAQLGQIFQNLITNAIKYRSAAPPKIRVEAARAGHLWEFSVKDNGQGLDMRYADQIFRVFRRLHGRDIPGTGIGLAIVKKIIESHGGRIHVISSPGQGADFRFTVPAV